MATSVEIVNPRPEDVPIPEYSVSHAGMSRGYAMSEMAELQRAFLQEGEGDVSTFRRVKLIVSKQSLDPVDVNDRGLGPMQYLPRFGLAPGLAMTIRNTIKETQGFLQKASRLVPGRTTWFIIDPHNLLMNTLGGAGNLDELHIAWLGLQKRMSLALRYLEKYEEHYRIPEQELRPTSPASTDEGIYTRWPSFKSSMTQLTFLFDNVPHHQAQLPEDYDRDTGELAVALAAPARLKNAFPDRVEEDRPSTIYYSVEGERRERNIWGDRTSWKNNEEFRVPDEDTPKELRISLESEEAKEDEDWDRRPSNPNDQEPTSSQVPYKPAETFFSTVPKSPPALRREIGIPGPNLPDPLRGMASAAPYGLANDSISRGLDQARKDKEASLRQRVQQWNSSPSLTPVIRYAPTQSTLRPIQEESSQQGTRDVPPHLSLWSDQPKGPGDGKGFEHRLPTEGGDDHWNQPSMPRGRANPVGAGQGGAGGGGDDDGDNDHGSALPQDQRDILPVLRLHRIPREVLLLEEGAEAAVQEVTGMAGLLDTLMWPLGRHTAP
ncbi:hypothetical protein DFH09DRAFT_1081164 [Mycena vulgaris]|nr:hypothetical protein DFH09DRAFT_1081164 [Mycena vulgaris]